MNRNVIAVVLIVGVGVVFAQPLPVCLYGGPQDEQAHALVEGVDPGFCMAGWTKSYGVGTPAKSNVLVVKTDPAGLPMWSVVSTGADDEEALSMVRTHDLAYVLTGWTRSYGPGIPNKNIIVFKLGPTGALLWSRVYGGMADDEAYSIYETIDQGFVITGRTHSFGPAPQPNVFVMKLDPQGMIQWMRTYWMAPNHQEDEGLSIVQTPDTGYAVVGRAKVLGPAVYDPFLLKLDQAGNIQWVLTASGESGNDEARSVAVDMQANICVAGLTRSFGTNPGARDDMFLAQFTLGGAPIFSWTYGWSAGDEQVLDDRSLAATMDGGTVLCGPTTSVGPGIPNPNFLVLKLDPMGMPMWCRSHPSPYDPGLQSDVPLPMLELAGGGYAIAGWSDSYNNLGGGDDFHLATLDPMGNRPVCVEPQEPLLDSMPWGEWAMEDTVCRPEYDTMPFAPIEVLFDSICWDTTGVGIEQGGGVRPRPALAVRGSGSGVELALVRSTVIEVQVFTPDGRQVVRLARREYAAGRHLLALPKRLTAGAYLVCVTGGGRSATAKIVRY
jgi:hypothetical protein